MSDNKKVERAIEYLTYILSQISDYPEEINIVFTTDERGLLLDLTANDRDLSRIIGRHGINIWSVRNIMRVWGQMNDAVVKVLVKGRGIEFYKSKTNQRE